MKTKVFLSLMFLIISTFLCVAHTNADYEPYTQLSLPEGYVNGIAYSPDGTQLVVAGSRRGIWIYEAGKGEELALLTGRAWGVNSVAFSPDGKTIATGSDDDDTVRLWEATTGDLKRTLTGHTDWVNSVVFSPDGKTIASGSEDETVRLWEATTGDLKRTLTGHTYHVYSVAFSPDGKTIASSSGSDTVRLWDATTGDLIRTLTGHTDWVFSVAFSPDGKTIATGDIYDTVRLWDASTGDLIRTLTEHTGAVYSVAFSPDGKTIATGSSDETVRLWDANTGDPLRMLTGHTDWVFSVAFSPDGKTLATGSWDGTVLLWDLLFTAEDAAFESATPVGDLTSTGSITVTFSSDPGYVTVSAGTVTGAGKTRTISGPFAVGALSLVLAWTNGDGSQTLTYNIIAPDVTAPEVVSSYPQDGAEGVDPKTVFEDGIVVIFNEDVFGDLMLLDGDDDVGWISSFFQDDRVTLDGVAGAELGYETEYTIIGKVSDAAGNETDVHITFVTQAEPLPPFNPGRIPGMGVDDGLVAYWAFNEASGATATDASGNGHDGTLLGSPKRTEGYFGGALAFDGVDDEVVVPYHADLNPETFSICFWVNVAPDSTGYRAPVSSMDVESGLSSGYNFYVNPDNIWEFRKGTGEWQSYLTGPEVGFGEWRHITGVYADGLTNFYVNGVLSNSTYSPPLSLNVNTRQELLIGAGANEAATHYFYFKGMIDEVRVYNRALDTAEIALVMETEVAELPVGPKIERPWLWMLVPTGISGSEAAVGTDYLAEASGGIVTETAIATEGARSGAFVGNRRWTPGRLAPTDRNNINDLMNTIGLATGDVDYHVAYGSIVLDVPHEQETLMYAGSDDAVKVWLNGDLVHDNPVDRWAFSYQESFPITLKEGENVLLVAVYDGIGNWAGFFGFAKETIYTVLPPVMSTAADVGDTLETATSLALDTSHTDAIFPGDDVDYFRIEVDQPGELTIYTTSDLDTVGELLTDDGEVLATGDDEGEFLNFQIVHSVRPGTYYANVGSYESASGSYTIYAAFTPALSADVNGDGVVNIQDLVLVAGAFGETGENVADVNGDGVVNIQDLVLVAGAFGDSAAAPAAHTLSSLTPETVQQWLTESKLIDEKSAVYQRGILVLEQLLAALIPEKTALLANYPNPFNPETWIPYQLAEPAEVTLTIYGIDGQVVRQLALGHQAVGLYQSRSRAAYWDGKNAVGEPVASGVYFYTLTAGDFTATRKMLIRK